MADPLTDWDLWPVERQVERMLAHEQAAADVVAAAVPAVAAVVHRAVAALRSGGRLVYLGAGTSGRLAALDAAEVTPTFGVPLGTVVAVVAGGAHALADPVEDLEDDESAARDDLAGIGLAATDLVVGVSASGHTPYTLAGLRHARALGAGTAAIVCSSASPMAAAADVAVELPVGPEAVRGSTRLSAGTSQKVVLNALSTLTMVRLGHVYADLMIGVRPDNAKLRRRVVTHVALASGRSEDDARAALETAGGDAKVAVLALRQGGEAPAARARLDAVHGDLRAALGERSPAAGRPGGGPGSGGLLLRGGRVLDVHRGRWDDVDLLLRDGVVVARQRFSDVPAGVEVRDVSGLLVTPGLVDAQVNGAAGHDVTRDPSSIPHVAAALLRHGVTAFVPTVITSARGTVEKALAVVQPSGTVAARVIGVHAEGPFLAYERRGAHPAQHLRAPSLDEVAAWSRDAGLVTVTLAPELPGALDVVRALTERGVTVWIGHSDATADQARAAVDAGARAVTHLFNAMSPFDHRTPGLGTAPFADDRLVAGMIVDNHHVAPAAVHATFAALGERLMLVSDTTAALDLPPGRAVLGDQEVVLDGETVRLAVDGETLAGSAVGLDHCVRTLVADTGCDPAAAFVAATRVPADLVGRPDLGRLDVGSRADVAVWDAALGLRSLLVDGVPVAL